MSDKRPYSSTKLRREVWERDKYQHPLTGRWVMDCHICKSPVDPVGGDLWDAEHVTRRALTQSDALEEIRPAHRKGCHSEKTKADNKATAKGKRIRDKHFGIRERKGFYRPGNLKYNWLSRRYERE